ncbi:malto-oligosyltrehalose synthase [Bordetella sp. 02P26C-1]|uniref:malto-oligosyltrehalose synthase n=1 Tax=Bordetella sp. 02P26C-1 TaxID=2683195 RepID=UPI001355A34C|nr:malto-oligosyltrehalose synthase [Bordetella sp. 02P26C-1]MVW79850.1 malto-oligosyltrehalose synthase [Bordetella sp. 02P26C-1]
MTPRATARLQLHADFPLDAARAQIDYFAALGISHLYLSPVTQARPGSNHGYDVLDPTCVSPELGGHAALQRLAEAARARRMGLILDIVPNHMAADARNPWWRDVLRHGRGSAYAAFFDIDWSVYSGKVLLPILGQPYEDALRAGEIRLGKQDGVPVVLAGGQALPVSGMPDPLELVRYTSAPDSPESFAFLDALLQQQHYELAYWRRAAAELNWRRFFEVTELVGLRVEDPTVFKAVHALPLSLYKQGMVDGLRIDHVDGLAEPGAYLRQLRDAMREAVFDREPYIVVEKILAPQEAVDHRWPVEGTSGYDFMDDVGALLHNPAACRPLQAQWQRYGGDSTRLKRQLQDIRAHLLSHNLVSERRTLMRAWNRLTSLSSADDAVWDRVIGAWLAAFPVYRSYAEDGGASTSDHSYWDEAARSARALLPESDHPKLAQFLSWLASPPAPDGRSALKRLQQVTPALAAKSLEDTLWYRHGALLSRNEVGAWPQRFALGATGFHARNRWRARHTPLTMLATATHDHKRGEDARARLAVITEVPQHWHAAADAFLALLPENAYTQADRYMLLQTLVGAWPAHWASKDIDSIDPQELDEWLTRVRAWQRKALREAKQHTTWTDPDNEYEAAAQACIDILDPGSGDPEALRALARVATSLIAPGHINSMAQTLLRNTTPGVPDLYQGTELWDYSMVDPDNRRPVDYGLRRALLTTENLTEPAPRHWQTGAVKQALIHRALQLRAADPAIFRGPYRPLCAVGPRAAHVVAFLRGSGRHVALAVAPRLCAWQIAGYARGDAQAARRFWEGTSLRLPHLPGMVWHDLLAERGLSLEQDGQIALADLLENWPVALCATSEAISAISRPSRA